MKTPSDEIFKLVKSLEPHEKGFIKRCLHKESDSSINLDLFDYLVSLSEYNEDKMLIVLKKITKKSVKHIKHTFLEFILKSLDLYYSDSTTEFRLYRTLFQIRILISKKLFSRANSLIKTAIEKAEKGNYFLLQLQLLAEQQLLAIESDNVANYEELRIRNLEAHKTLIANYDAFQQNQELIYELWKLSVKDGFYPEKVKHQNAKIIYSGIVKKKKDSHPGSKPTSIVLQELFIESQSLLLLNEYQKAKTCFEKYLSLYELFYDQTEHPSEYLGHLNKGLTYCVLTFDKKLLKEYEAKAEKYFNTLPIKSRSAAVLKNYINIKNNVIVFLTHNEDFIEARTKAEAIEKEMLSESVSPSFRKIFLANLCQIYLYSGEIKKSLHCYNSLVNNIEFDTVRTDIDAEMNLLSLAIFYELKSDEKIENLIRSFKRKSNYKVQCEVYKLIIDFFAAINKEKEKLKSKILFEEVLKKINAIDKKDPESLFFLKSALIPVWIRKKQHEFRS